MHKQSVHGKIVVALTTDLNRCDIKIIPNAFRDNRFSA